jgi:hypothetical protein
MEWTSGTRATAGAGALAMAAGIALTSRGVLLSDLDNAVAGTCLTLVSLTAIALACLRRWIVDTREEQRVLAAAQREAERERSRYFAAQAALENEMGRLNRDMAAERQRIAAQLLQEREAMRIEFEEKRAEVITETVEATVLMFRNGKFAPETAATGQLIRFPRQEPTAAPQRERSREHGIVGP